MRSHIVGDCSTKEAILGTRHGIRILFVTFARILITFVISQVVIVLLLAFCVFFSIMLLLFGGKFSCKVHVVPSFSLLNVS